MGSRVEDLQALARMLDEGEITADEYEMVKAELIAAPASDWGETPAPKTGPRQPIATEGEEPAESGEESPTLWEQLRGIPRPYLVAAGFALLVLVVAVIVLGGDAPQQVTVPRNAAPTEPGPPPPDSLGIAFATLGEEWNTLDLAPLIRRGVSVTPEAGPLDGFLYRFDDAAVLAGAYDPSDGYLRALMVRAGLFHSDLANLYVHLCYLLHPNDQGCLETYIEEAGVYGATVAEFADVDLETSWVYQGNRWSFTLVDNVETIRIQAPGQG